MDKRDYFGFVVFAANTQVEHFVDRLLAIHPVIAVARRFCDSESVGGLPVGGSLQSNSGDDEVGFVHNPSSRCPRCPGTPPLQTSECPRCLGTGVHDVVEPHTSGPTTVAFWDLVRLCLAHRHLRTGAIGLS